MRKGSIQRWGQFELCPDGIAFFLYEFAVGGCGGEILCGSFEVALLGGGGDRLARVQDREDFAQPYEVAVPSAD
jgi:hypothetical protein